MDVYGKSKWPVARFSKVPKTFWGLDKLSSRLIRECAELISPYISIIFNCCQTTSTFPDDWKLAKVTPKFE